MAVVTGGSNAAAHRSLALSLASSASDSMTGQTFVIDGGWTIA